MKTFETTATVSPEGSMTIIAPETVSPGTYHMIVVIDEEAQTRQTGPREIRHLPAWEWKAWPPDASFRREDVYGDDGR